jgi:hypothetical protein
VYLLGVDQLIPCVDTFNLMYHVMVTGYISCVSVRGRPANTLCRQTTQLIYPVTIT